MSPKRPRTFQPNVFGSDPPEVNARFWALVVATGVGAGVAGGLLMKLLRAVQHASWFYSRGEFLKAVQHTSPLHRVEVVATAGLVAALGGLAIRRLTGESGGEVSDAVWTKEGKTNFIPTTARATLSIVIVGMGASLGREGAPQQVAAGIAAKFAKWAAIDAAQRRLLVACAAGAGMAAVYNVPLGASLYAIEVLLGQVSMPYVLPALATSFIATAVSWAFLPAQPTYLVAPHGTSVAEVAWAVVFGPLAGLGAIAYIRLIAFASAHKPSGWPTVPASLAVFGMLGAAAIAYPQLLGNGKDAVQLVMVNSAPLVVVAALVVLKPLATAACLGAGAPGGLFTPTLTYGVLLGALGGFAAHALVPGTPIATFGMIGGAAVLAAAMGGPVSGTVLVLELTHEGLGMMIPILTAVVGATAVTRHFEPRSIYSARISALNG